MIGAGADVGRRTTAARRAPSWLPALVLTACAGAVDHGGAAPPVLAASAEAPRRGPGIAVDPVLELPRATPTARAESGLVVLAEPADTRPARKVVDDFFAAVVGEAGDDLERLLDRAARVRTSAKARPGEPALSHWRRRLERLDYTSLASEVLYRASEVEVHTAEDAAALSPTRALPVLPQGQDVLVRVPVASANAAKFFGGEIVFLLKPAPGGYKIGELFEDFRLP